MPRRISRAKEFVSAVIGGATTCILCVGIDEYYHCSQENENITEEARVAAIDHCHLGQSNGSHEETTTCPG
jgi:hypothetical protein